MKDREKGWRFWAVVVGAIVISAILLGMPGVSPAGLGDTGIFGTVGIGTETPQRKLHVFDNVALFERSVNSAGFIIKRTPFLRYVFGVDDPAGFVLKTYPEGQPATTRLVVTHDGKVGIGTENPDEKLTVLNDSGPAIRGYSSATDAFGVIGNSETGAGVGGYSPSENGIFGGSETGAGVHGYSPDGTGVVGTSDNHPGVHGYSVNSTGVVGESGTGWAGHFLGDVHVEGTLYKNAGAFKIDHPLDPENKYLNHSFVESPEMMNIYNGNVVLNEKGEASVKLPSYFEALNRDFCYQLTCIGGYAPVYIAEGVKNNCFKIAGGKPGMEVSWQVTGIRQDAYAKAHPIQVEENKPKENVAPVYNPESLNSLKEKVKNMAKIK